MNHALPPARSKRSVVHTRKLKADPLVSFVSLTFVLKTLFFLLFDEKHESTKI